MYTITMTGVENIIGKIYWIRGEKAMFMGSISVDQMILSSQSISQKTGQSNMVISASIFLGTGSFETIRHLLQVNWFVIIWINSADYHISKTNEPLPGLC